MVFTGLIGMYLITNPHFGHLKIGDIYGFASGIVAALALVTVNELRKTDSAMAIFLALSVFGTLAGLLGMIVQHPVWPSSAGWLILTAMGITGAIGQILFTWALKFAPAGEASITQLSAIIYAAICGILWFGDPLTLRIACGAVLVLGSAAYISVHQSRGEVVRP